MKKVTYFSSLISFLILLFPLFSHAHITGASWEKIVGNYKLDIGYDPTTIVAGQAQRFDFNIADPTSGQGMDFSDVWVRISNGQDTVFATGIHRLTFGLTTLTMEFPKPGNYTLNARFEKDDNTIVQSDFPITVVAGVEDPTVPRSRGNWVFGAILGLVVGIIVGVATYFILKKSRVKN